MKYTKEEARVKKQALTSLQVRAIPPVVKTTGISPTMSMKMNKNIKEMSKKLESEFWYDFKNWKELN